MKITSASWTNLLDGRGDKLFPTSIVEFFNGDNVIFQKRVDCYEIIYLVNVFSEMIATQLNFYRSTADRNVIEIEGIDELKKKLEDSIRNAKNALETLNYYQISQEDKKIFEMLVMRK